MSFFSYALGTVILILVLLRQVRVRPVPRVFQPRLPIVIGVIGLLETFSYSGDHHVSGTAWAWVIGSLVIGALGLGVGLLVGIFGGPLQRCRRLVRPDALEVRFAPWGFQPCGRGGGTFGSLSRA